MTHNQRIALVALVYTLLAVGVFILPEKIFAFPSSTFVADYIKVVGVGLTTLTALTAAVVSPFLTPSLESRKRVAVEVVEAHKQLYSAARYYYRTLARLEAGAWTASLGRKAEGIMEQAEGALAFVSDDAESDWMVAWQTLHAIAESASTETQEQAALWREKVKTAGEAVQSVKRRVAMDVLQS